jgi:two-component system sensor histidine kinase CpxA
MANQQLLRSAIENVVKNAIHYHDGEQPIEVNLSSENNTMQITCCDRGPGIPEAQLSQIFKPFYRISASRDRATGGYGLGLAITKRAIELHGGSVQAHNRQGHGLCVTLCLPLTQ